MTDVEERLAEMERRLDKHAELLRDLRSKVATLEAENQTSARSSTLDDMRVAVRHVEPTPLPDTCLMCSAVKEEGRTLTMTCATCADVRREGIRKGGIFREAIITGSCGMCKRSTGRSTNLICGTCRPGVKVWQENVRTQMREQRALEAAMEEEEDKK